MKQRVYLETTVISVLAARPSRDLVLAGHQAVTWKWWEQRRDKFEVFVSQPVLDEAGQGDADAARRRREILSTVPLLDVTEESLSLAEALIAKHALPPRSAADALHIAVAAVNGMDYLLTWNCRHIANAELAPAIREMVEDFGYEAPIICTPDELLGEENEEPI